MSDVFASLAAGTARPAGSGQGGAAGETAVRVVDPSPDLARLSTGESLRGTVVGKGDHGHLMVRTRLGVMELATTRPLPVGSEVVLQVRSVGPQVIMTLLPVESAASNAAAQSGQVQGGQVQSGQVQAQTPTLPGGPSAPGTPPHVPPPNPHDLVQTAHVLRGVLHAAPPVPSLAGLPTAQPGAELLVRILALGVQSGGIQSGGIQSGTAAPAVPGQPGTPVAVQSPAQGAGQGGAPLPGQPVGQPAGQAPGTPGGVGTSAGSTTTPLAGNAANAGPGGATPVSRPPATGTGVAGTPAANAPPPSSLAAANPGLRLAPQTPVASSGHNVASALQNVSTEAAARAAGALPAQPGSGQPAPAGIEAGLRVTALVTATTSSGQPILHTPLGTLTLDTRAALPLGSSLALQVTLPEAPATPATQALAAAWPSLEALEETIFHGLQPAQVDAVARALPQVGPRLASGMLFFLSALNQGNIGGWLAPAAAAAERAEHGDLFERLGREFAGLNRSIDTAAGEWRFVNLPLWSEQGLRELRCFFRHQEHGGAGKSGDGEKATRFVLELELERHGELQLDGLVRARRFDLLLRSRRPLPALVRGDLLALFEEANAIAGYTGQLVFQASADWLQLLAAQSAGRPHDGVNV